MLSALIGLPPSRPGLFRLWHSLQSAIHIPNTPKSSGRKFTGARSRPDLKVVMPWKVED